MGRGRVGHGVREGEGEGAGCKKGDTHSPTTPTTPTHHAHPTLQEPLTPHNLRLLAAELGPECGPSVERLKRRAGVLPHVQRALPHVGRGGG